MKEKFQKGIQVASSLATMCSLAMCNAMAANAGTAKTKIIAALEYVGIGICILGGLFIVVGLINFAIAYFDGGSGPENNKATKQMGGGAMVLVVGAALTTIANVIL